MYPSLVPLIFFSVAAAFTPGPNNIIGSYSGFNFGIKKMIFLQTVDLSWKSHIQYLEQLRQVIGLRSYGQRDPLIEYKKEAFDLFENLLEKMKTDLVTILINLNFAQKPIENPKKVEIPVASKKKMKRNEPCYCGSGKKYKHCHGSL